MAAVPQQGSYLLLVVDGDTNAELASAWQDACAAWSDNAGHDRLLEIARKQGSYVWLATRYRKLAERGDEIAKQRLARIQRVLLATMLYRPASGESAPAYRGVSRVLMLLVVLFGLGYLFLANAARTHAANRAQPPRAAERGSAMLVVLIITTALLAGMATLTSVQMSTSRSAQLTRSKTASLHCAEAGIVTARSAVSSNYKNWNAALAAGTEPSWFTSLSKDLDGDGIADFSLKLTDNVDETGTNDPTKDNDLAVYVVSTCTKYAETPVQVTELVRYNGGGNCYQAQLGGCGGNNNAN